MLVTGAAGFVGSHVARAAAARGDRVFGLVRPGADLWRLEEADGAVEVIECDLLDLELDGSQLRGVSVVHHLAAAGVDPRRGDEQALLDVNVRGTWRLARAARALGVERFVYCGSCFEYGAGSQLREDAPLRPRSVYAASKSAGWLLATAEVERGLPLVTMRPFTAYGPYEAAHRLVPSCILGALDAARVEVTSGEQRRDFVYVEDVAEAFLSAADRAEAIGKIFNICTGVETAVRDVAVRAAAGARPGVAPELGVVPQRSGEADVLSGDPRHAADVLGFTARTPLAEGLRRTTTWFREHRDSYEQQVAAR